MSKEILKPVTDALAVRLKTPLMGTFILSWLLINHSLVLEFLFTTLDSKVGMAKASEFNLYTDLVYPIGLTLLYLLIVPAAQVLIDTVILDTLGEYRKKHDSRLAKNEIESTREHQIVLRDRKLDSWDSDKVRLKNNIDSLEEKIEELNATLETLRQKNKDLDGDNKELTAAINEAVESLEAPAMNVGSEYEDTRSPFEIYSEIANKLRLTVMRLGNDLPF
ncbi:hypothetical protein AB4289_06145 [Vibrio cyclitrophicus]